MPGTKLPLAVVLLLLAATALLLSCPAAAAMSDDYGKWPRRRLEDAVAPEFGSSLAAGQRYISYNTLNRNRQACRGGCAAQGASYTRPCTYFEKCRG